jgi:hypothetical protein
MSVSIAALFMIREPHPPQDHAVQLDVADQAKRTIQVAVRADLPGPVRRMTAPKTGKAANSDPGVWLLASVSTVLR